MGGVIRSNTGIAIPISGDDAALRRQLEDLKNTAKNPNLLKITPQLSFEERQITAEMNKVIRRMEREAAQAAAKIRLFGDGGGGGASLPTSRQAALAGRQSASLDSAIAGAAFEARAAGRAAGPMAAPPGAAPAGFRAGWGQVLGAAWGIDQGLSGLQSAGALIGAMRQPTAEDRGLAAMRAAQSFPVLGRVIGFADELLGTSEGLEASKFARGAITDANRASAAAYNSLHIGRATRGGDVGGAVRLRGEASQVRPLEEQMSALNKEFLSKGISSSLPFGGGDSYVNATGKNLKAAMKRLQEAIDATKTEIEEAAKEAEKGAAVRRQSASFAARATDAATDAATAFTPSQKAAAQYRGALAAFNQRSSERWANAKDSPEDKASAKETDEAERRQLESQFQSGSMAAAGEEVAEIMRGRAVAAARRRGEATAATNIRRQRIAARGAARSAMLRASGQSLAAELADYDTETAVEQEGAEFPLMGTRLAAGGRGAGRAAIIARQRRERAGVSDSLTARRDIANLSGQGMDQAAGIVGMLAGQASERRSATDTTDLKQLGAAQDAELRAARARMLRPTQYLHGTSVFEDAAGGPGGNAGADQLGALEKIDQGIKELPEKIAAAIAERQTAGSGADPSPGAGQDVY